nr:MAG TPA: coiled-coil domain-containing protein [Caudoviricetes sp.]
MRTVGMGVSSKSEEGKKLLAEITDLKAENVALKQEITDLKAKKATKKTKEEDQNPAEE